MKVQLTDGGEVACTYFVLCDRAAEGVVEVGILGYVPACRRCADHVGLELLEGEFEIEVPA